MAFFSTVEAGDLLERTTWFRDGSSDSKGDIRGGYRLGGAVEGAVPVSARACDFDPRKTCLAELGRARKEGKCRGVGKSKKLEAQL